MLLRLGLSFALCLAMVIARADTPQTLFADGFELLKTGKAKEAAAKFEAGLKSDPRNALAHYYLGEAYFRLQRNAEAIDQFQRSLGLDPASSVAKNAQAHLSQLSASTETNGAEANIGHISSQSPASPAVAPKAPTLIRLACRVESTRDHQKMEYKISFDPVEGIVVN